jgi:peptidoglycan/LPS O-acetylase OafA/YrhL
MTGIMSPAPKNKIYALEAVRGLASILVFFHHFILGFLPQYHGVLAGTNGSQALIGSVFFAFINGTAAVVLFFVLSGFVLSYKFFLYNNMSYNRIWCLSV